MELKIWKKKMVKNMILLQLSCLLVWRMLRRRRLVKSRRNNLGRSGGKRRDACKHIKNVLTRSLNINILTRLKMTRRSDGIYTDKMKGVRDLVRRISTPYML